MNLLMIELLAFSVCFLVAWYFLYRVLPRIGRWAALCILHNIRDSIYRIEAKRESSVDSLVFEDMLFILTLIIHMVRDTPRRASLPVLLRMLAGSPRRTRSMPADWRSKRYEFEYGCLFKSDEDQQNLDAALSEFQKRNIAILLYLTTSHPFFALGILFILPFSLLLKTNGVRPDVGSVGMTLQTIRAFDEHPRHHSYA